MNYIYDLKFNEEPDYDWIISLLKDEMDALTANNQKKNILICTADVSYEGYKFCGTLKSKITHLDSSVQISNLKPNNLINSTKNNEIG